MAPLLAPLQARLDQVDQRLAMLDGRMQALEAGNRQMRRLGALVSVFPILCLILPC